MRTILEEVLAANDSYAATFGDKASLPMPPGRRFAILTCMDARLDPANIAGLSEGDAHVIRNAGGRASDDAIRSLVISYKLLGTREWFVIHHTDCGMETFTDEIMRGLLAGSLETGPLIRVQTGRPADDGMTPIRGPADPLRTSARRAELNHNVALAVECVANRHAERLAAVKRARIAPDGGVAGLGDRADELERRIVVSQCQNPCPHAPGAANQEKSQRSHAIVSRSSPISRAVFSSPAALAARMPRSSVFRASWPKPAPI